AQVAEVNGLSDVLFEAGLDAVLNVLFLAEAAEGNAADITGAQAAHDLEAASIGQPKVADEQVELSALPQRDRLVNAARHLHRAADGGEEPRHGGAGVGVILDQQYAEALRAPNLGA